jgi:hypothetical protein
MQLPEFESKLQNLPHMDSGSNLVTGWFTEFQIASLRVDIKEYILRRATAFHEKFGALEGAASSQTSAAGRVPLRDFQCLAVLCCAANISQSTHLLF